jgi:hypothetical protein
MVEIAKAQGRGLVGIVEGRVFGVVLSESYTARKNIEV